jgi:hypothetical protein
MIKIMKITKRLVAILLVVLMISLFTGVAKAETENDSRYTIVLQSTTNEDIVYSATGEDGDTYDTISAYFEDITADTYNVLVYYLNVEAGNNSLCKLTQWTCEAEEGETDNIKVNYYTVTEDVDVEVVAIHHPLSDDNIDESNEVVQNIIEQSKIQENDVESTQNENSSNVALYIIVLIVVCIVIAVVFYSRKKNK